MPQLKRGSNDKIVIYASDHNPPHVHLISADFEAMPALSDGSVIAASGRYPTRAVREAQDWMAENRAWLYEKWEELR